MKWENVPFGNVLEKIDVFICCLSAFHVQVPLSLIRGLLSENVLHMDD